MISSAVNESNWSHQHSSAMWKNGKVLEEGRMCWVDALLSLYHNYLHWPLLVSLIQVCMKFHAMNLR